jgi:hypothetical protein
MLSTEHNTRRSVRLLAAMAAVCAMLLTGCGGASKTTTTAVTTSHTTTTPKTAALTEAIKVAGTSTPVSAASAQPGQTVEFLTQVPGLATAPPTPVTLRFSRGPSSTWTVVASADGRTSSAKLTSQNGKALTLVLPRYTCMLPPAPTFCPARNASDHGDHIDVHFSTRPSTPIEMVATAGPIAGAPAAVKPGTLSVPAFTAQELVVVHTTSAAASGAAPKPSSSAAARPGDELEFLTRLSSRAPGGDNGAPQRVTIAFDQGPAATLHVIATVARGVSSTATVTGEAGASIELVEPRYACAIPPAPTYCPLLKLTAASHRYALTFAASPTTSDIELIALVQAG